MRRAPLAPALAMILMIVSLGCAAAEGWRTALPQAQLSGEGEYRWFGLRLYTAQLWSPHLPPNLDASFALQVTYARAFTAQRLVDTSIEEIRRIHRPNVTAATLERWREALQKVFVDVRAGDSLTGVYLPGEGVRFFANDRATGQIDDAALARAFFAIWLDPATRAPALRLKLLGQAE